MTVLIRNPKMLGWWWEGGVGKNTKQRKNLKGIVLLVIYPRAVTE